MTTLTQRVQPLFSALLPQDPARREFLRLGLLRVIIVTNVVLGVYYLSWRWLNTVNWQYWFIAVPLVVAETYSFIESTLFSMMMWQLKNRGEPPPPLSNVTVDVFVCCYNEPVELVRETITAARDIRYPHNTYLLDDGNSAAMRAMTEEEGVGYIVRTTEWRGHERHAKAGNLNNALFQTTGEFMLILDADQIPSPEILDRTLGFFRDPKMAFVQTPQWFYNIPPGDPYGSDCPLFYGPIQQAKDGWNSAFFCGSNAILRREALMELGVRQYVRELQPRVRRALQTAEKLLKQAERDLQQTSLSTVMTPETERIQMALSQLRAAVRDAQRQLKGDMPIQEITWEFQRRAQEAAEAVVTHDLAQIQADLVDLSVMDIEAADITRSFADVLDDEQRLADLTGRAASPLLAIEAVRQLLLAVDMDRADEALPVLPFARISVTEDMATAMRLHGAGWKSAYHHEVLAHGLAPEDLRSALQQRLRWAQGTIQIMLRENPLRLPGLSLGQRLNYFTTMWTYPAGFFTVMYLIAPVAYMLFEWLPVKAFSAEFFWHLIPYLVVNQLLFIVIGWKLPTWRGQQYSLSLFPLWIQSVTSAVKNVYFGSKLGFVVTPKTRQGGVHWSLVRVQLVFIILILGSTAYGLARLAFGLTDEFIAIIINAFWSCYNLIMLSVIIDAVTYQPAEKEETIDAENMAGTLRGRIGAGVR